MSKTILATIRSVIAIIARRSAAQPPKTRVGRLVGIIEPIVLVVMWMVYFLGAREAMTGTLGFIASAVLATLLVLLFLTFIETAFRGKTFATKWVARILTVGLVLATACMTGSLAYVLLFGTQYANRQAFDAVRLLETYTQQSAHEYQAAADRYNAVATLSAAREQDEIKNGHTCGDNSNKSAGVRSNWRGAFAAATKSDANEISVRARTVAALADEVKAFGAHFNPEDTAAMQAQWADLLGRVQAVGGDGRPAQIGDDLETRLNAADRNIGQEPQAGGKMHVVVCPDPTLRDVGEGAISALRTIKPPPSLADSIVGVDLQTALHRMFVMISAPFGWSSEHAASEEYVVFFMATIMEMMFVGTKWISYAEMSRDPLMARATATESVRGILNEVASVFRSDNTRHEFFLLRPFVIERTATYVRLVVPDGAANAESAASSLEVLVARGYARFVDERPMSDLDTNVIERVGKPKSKGERATVFDIRADAWNALMAESAASSTWS